MLRNWSEKLGTKFLSTTCTLGYTVVKISSLNDAFSEFFELEASPVEGESLQQKDKRRKRKGAKITKIEKPASVKMS